MLRRPLQLHTGENTQDLSSPKTWDMKCSLKSTEKLYIFKWAVSKHTLEEETEACPIHSLSSQSPWRSLQGGCAPALERVHVRGEGPSVVWKPRWRTYFKQKSTSVLSHREPAPKGIPKQNLPRLPTFQTLLTGGSSLRTKETLSALHRWMQPPLPRARTSNGGQVPRSVHNLRPYYRPSYQQNA